MKKFRDSKQAKEYWKRINSVSKNLNIIPFATFEEIYSRKDQEIVFLEGCLFRISNIIRSHKAELHGYIFSHKVLRELNKVRFTINQIMKVYDLHRIECIVDVDNKCLQRIMEMLHFKDEGIRENGVFFNDKCIDGIGYVYLS